MSIAEAAQRLGRSIEQVRRYLREGKLRGQRIGGQWFIEEDALTALPLGRGTGEPRVCEAVATYEARTMKTAKVKDREALVREEWLRGVDEIAEEIRSEVGEVQFDVVEALRTSREEH